MLEAPPLGLYVHLPWCVKKCPYCDFNSYEVPAGEFPGERYVAALLRDLERDLPLAAGRSVETVFFGGGTPSLFDPADIAALLQGVRERLPLANGAEITLEANPGTVERGDFSGYREAGITRVSLGAQSFAAEQLRLLGRIHAAADTGAAVADLGRAGLANFNLDLMYALPAQTLDLAVADLAAAIGLSPPHLSYYHLTLEPGTAFYRKPPVLPDEELALAIEATSTERLTAAGYRRYEVSAWATPGAECRHNVNYWRFGDYLGLGAGAHGKLTVPDEDRIVRTLKPRNPATYLATRDDPVQGLRTDVDRHDRPFEFMLNALRLSDGFRQADFAARTGLPLASVGAVVDDLLGRGLLEEGGDRLRASPLGWRFLNDVQAAFLVSSPTSGT